MQVAKQQVETMLQTLPDDCSLEDIQHHLYVIEKIKNGVTRAEAEDGVSQQNVEKYLSRWLDASPIQLESTYDYHSTNSAGR